MAKARIAVVVALLLAATATIALTAPLGADYPGPPCPTCDYAAPPIEALVHGQVNTFFHTQPVMGSFSLLLRAPFAALSYLGHHTLRSEYRLGSLACLLAVALLAWWLVAIMERRGARWWQQLLIGGLMVAGPLTFKSLSWGHPEELLAGALCVGAVMLSAYGRSVAAGVVLGLALATKPWAVLAVLPVVMVAKQRRGALIGTAALVGAALTVPMLIGDPARFWQMEHTYSVAGRGVTPPDIWWSYGHQGGLLLTPHGASATFVVPAWVWSVAHPLVLVLGVVLAVGYWRSTVSGAGAGTPSAAGSSTGVPSRAGGPLETGVVLHLLALLLLLRCILDPTDYSYYHAPFMIALVAAEALGARRLPYAALVSAAAVWVLDQFVAPHGAGALQAGYLLWALPTAVYLALSVFAPSAFTRASARLRAAGAEAVASS